jgi:chromosome segregation ATPase
MTDSGSDNIVNFVVSATAFSKDRAEQDVAIATRFMQQGVAYLSLQNMVSNYEAQVLNTESELRARITQVRIELKLLQERAKNLENLQRRFPANSASGSQQVVDLADSNAKYMPISTQLVAVQSDINASEEQLTRMQDQLARIKVTSDFVTPALPLVAKEFNGLALVDQLLKIEADLRKTAPADDSNAQQALNTIQAQLISTKTFFSKGLESRLAPSVRKTFGVIPAAAIGLFLGLLLALAWSVWPLLLQRRTAPTA